MRRIQFSIRTILAAITLAGLTVLLIQNWTLEPRFTSRPLAYVAPVVPADYDENGRHPPEFLQISMCRQIRYRNGHNLYLLAHRDGWESCRSRFYYNDESAYDWNSNFERHENELPRTEWIYAHQFNAVTDGRIQCRDAILELLNHQTEEQLRNSISYSRFWHTIPILLLILALFAIARKSKVGR
jgi:hypothetical protein